MPKDIQFSGQKNFHYHCLYSVCSASKSHLELIFTGTEIAGHDILIHMFLNGRVGAGGGIELTDYKDNLIFKCAKIIYRFIDLDDYYASGYFLKPGVLDYPLGEFSNEGYYHISNNYSHLLITKAGNGIEVSIPDGDNSNSIHLNYDQVQKLIEIFLQSLRRR